MSTTRILFLLTIATMAMSAKAAPVPMLFEAGNERLARLTLVDEAGERDPRDWRLQTENFAPPTEAQDELRLKVKLRPNRAMGHMSLSF